MQMQAVESSMLREIGYDQSAQVMYARFKNGRLYAYDGFPLSVWQAWQAAQSKGAFFVANIRSNYQGRIVE